jgi:hypothetical protein
MRPDLQQRPVQKEGLEPEREQQQPVLLVLVLVLRGERG